jgi:hypothetical protein
MEPKTFLLVFDVQKNAGALSALHRYIMDSRDFVGYWNYIPFVYIVKTYEPLASVREKLRFILTNGNFLIAEVSAAQMDGLLTRDAWDWFKHSHGQLSIADLLSGSGSDKPTTGIGGATGPGSLGIGGFAGLLGDPNKK